jgi:hypothetical protein
MELPTSGRLIDAAEYYRLSQNSESIRALLRQVCRLLPAENTDSQTLAKCIETHEYDDTLALIAVANELHEDDLLSPEVLLLIRRHCSVGRLQGILNCICLIPKEGAAIREYLKFLIAGKVKQLAYAWGDGDLIKT